MGRSGTTWVAQLINHDASHRLMFEPFFPARVPEAQPFDYIQYLRPLSREPARVEAARTILAGRIRNPHVDQGNRGFLFRRRIIKEIRCNLMLRWLAALAPRMRIVLVVRHPFAVADSWLRLGWGAEALGRRTDFEIMMAQKALLQDFAELNDIAATIDPNEPLDRILFQWCAFHLVPLRQFAADELFLVHYEKLIDPSSREVDRLFAYLGRTIDPQRLAAARKTPSLTATLPPSNRGAAAPPGADNTARSAGEYARSGPAADDSERSAGEHGDWRQRFSPAQLDRGRRMIEQCALPEWYPHLYL